MQNVLAELLRVAGFDPTNLFADANSPAIRAAYEGNRLEAIKIGVFGAPSYVLDGEIFWGQDRLDLLGRCARERTCGRSRRNPRRVELSPRATARGRASR